jgi:GT2 family glycosyltransferase
MITIIYSTHKDQQYNNEFKNHIINSIGIKDFQILEYVNMNQYSLAEVYNKGIKESKYDIIVCCHNDIKLETGWGKKLIDDFSNNPDYGIIGKAGSCYFPESGVYWEKMNQTMVGQVYHHPIGKNKWLSRYSAKLPFLIPVVTIDGLFISFNKNKITHTFDETIGKFHFYDHLFCLPNYLDGVKIGVTTSFEITHQSVGEPNQEFWESKEKFLEKFGNKLPLDLKPEQVFVSTIKTKPIKNVGKVAIIIPTKGKTEMLFNCIDSFYENSSSDLFHIFIADTGSTEEEKEIIKNKINSVNNIKLIEYDYYNFAKINNDVVKNHISDDYEFLLFCNNDIKILNDIITGMLKIFKENKNTGTVGCRLHFEDKTIQHDGILAFIDTTGSFNVSHLGLRSYYNFSNSNKKVIGSTGALLMIKKKIFEKCGFFNENYITCFEDVELNMKCLLMNLQNYCDSNLVAYHYESQTRNEDITDSKNMFTDFNLNLIPFVNQNFEKIKNYVAISDGQSFKIKKIKVLIGCYFFKDYTGSEMYVFELAKNLLKLDCDVSIISSISDGPLTKRAMDLGIKIYTFQNIPVNINYDIIHTQHHPITVELDKYFPNTKKITTIHSEVIEIENPYMCLNVKKYIAIRLEIKNFLIKNFPIIDKDIELIYNPVDETRFNKKGTSDQNFILFVGSLENLRRQSLLDICQYAKEVGKELWIVGNNHSNYLNDLIANPHVKYFNSTSNIEEFVKKCSETAGILLGRTTIEGWMCGKPGWIYNIDAQGNIINKEKHNPPDDIEKYYSSNVAEKIKKEYLKILLN